MKWTPLIVFIFGLALLAYYRINEPKQAITMRPAPLDSQPFVNSRLSDQQMNAQAVESKSEERKSLLIANFLLALERSDLEGSQVEALDDDAFIQAVDEWSSEITNELGMHVDNEDLDAIGEAVYGDLASPYARYLAFDWATRYGAIGNFKKTERLILRLTDDRSVQGGSEAYDERTEEPEERACRLLGNQMIETHLRRLWINLKADERKIIVKQLKESSSDGAQRILSSIYSWGEEP